MHILWVVLFYRIISYLVLSISPPLPSPPLLSYFLLSPSSLISSPPLPSLLTPSSLPLSNLLSSWYTVGVSILAPWCQIFFYLISPSLELTVQSTQSGSWTNSPFFTTHSRLNFCPFGRRGSQVEGRGMGRKQPVGANCSRKICSTLPVHSKQPRCSMC